MQKFEKILVYIGLGVLSILAVLGIVKGLNHMLEKRRSAITDGE